MHSEKPDSQSSQSFGREGLLGTQYTQLRDSRPAAKHWSGGLVEGKQRLENAFIVVMFTLRLSTKKCVCLNNVLGL